MRTHRLLVLLPFLLTCSSKLSPEGSTPGTCSDLADNDEDALFDCDDPGCAADPDCVDGDGDGDTDGGTGDGTGGGTDTDGGSGTDTDTDGGTGGGSTGGDTDGDTDGETGDTWALTGTVELEVTNLDTSEADTCTGAATGSLSQADPFFVLAVECDGFTGFGRYLGLGDGGLEGEVDQTDNSITGVVLWQFMSDAVWTGTWEGPMMTGAWSGSFAEGAAPVGYEGSISLEAADYDDGGGDTGEPTDTADPRGGDDEGGGEEGGG
jgi:hypothetical protein